MDRDQMAAEMARKPDAQLLVEWIDENCGDVSFGISPAVSMQDVQVVVDAYFAALES